MKSQRRFTAAFKANVALEAIRERESLSALRSKYELSASQVSKWKQEFLEKSWKSLIKRPKRRYKS